MSAAEEDWIGLEFRDDGATRLASGPGGALVYIEGPEDAPTIRLGDDAVIDWTGPLAGNIRRATDPIGKWGVGFFDASEFGNRDGRRVQQAVLYRTLDPLPRGTRIPVYPADGSKR